MNDAPKKEKKTRTSRAKKSFENAVDPTDMEAGMRMQSAGGILRDRRETLGLTLQQVSGKLNIRSGHLQALENGEIKNLPGTAYAVGFLRSYANFLGLPAEDMVRRYKAEQGLDAKAAKPDLGAYPVPRSEQRLPGGATVLGALALAAVVIGLWSTTSTRDETEMLDGVQSPMVVDAPIAPVNSDISELTGQPVLGEFVPPSADADNENGVTADAGEQGEATTVVAETSPAPVVAPVDAAPASENVTPAVQEPAKAAAVETTPATPVVTDPVPKPNEVTEKVQPAVPTTPAKPLNSETSAPMGAPAGKSRVSVTASSLSWVQIIDARGQIIFKKVLRPGEVYRVPDEKGLTLSTGNAGGVALVVDGKQQPVLGRKGDIIRGISLDPTAASAPRGTKYNPWMR